MGESIRTANEVTRVSLGGMKFIGIPVVVSFKDGDFGRIEQMKQLFLDRKDEIQGIVDPDILWAPWYANDIMFTYFHAVQVESLDDLPEGMHGFTIPAGEYATVHYEGPTPWDPDPYGLLHEYRQREGLEADSRQMVLEKYRFDRQDDADGQLYIDVFGPLQIK